MNNEEAAELASDKRTSPEILDKLARNGNVEIRCRVAKNPNTPTKTLNRLVRDEMVGLRFEAALHKNSTEETYLIFCSIAFMKRIFTKENYMFY